MSGFVSPTACKSKFIQMPKLMDLSCQSVNNSNDFGSNWYMRFAYFLRMDVFKARELFRKHGKGYIYTSTGFVMSDTPYQRRKMVANFGACVVVTANGDMWVRKPEQIGAKNRRKAILLDQEKRREIQRLENDLRIIKRRERLFKDGQTKSSSKRSGKANSHADIGKYVNYPNTRLSVFESQSIDRLVTIHIAM